MMMRVHKVGLLPLGLLLAGLWGCPPQPVEECTQDADCEGGTCLEDGTCQPAQTGDCELDSDCGNGRVCSLGVCVVRNGRDGGGSGSPADAGGSSSGGAGLGVLYLSPSDSVDFGSPLLDMPITKNIVVRNDGQGPLTISAVTRGGQTSAEYTVTPPPLPRVLQPGDEDRIVVSYTLTDAEADIGTVVINSDARACTFNCPDATSVRVELFSAFKGGKDLDVTPPVHDFGFQDVGTSSADFPFQATNLGTQTRYLTIQSATLAGADAINFELNTQNLVLPALVFPGDLLAFPVRYKPLSMGSHNATLTVVADSDDPLRRMITVTVTGRSVAMVNVTVDDVGFGSVQVGQEVTRSTTIRNAGNVPISVTAASFANGMGTMGFYLANPSQFPLSQPIAANNGTATVDLVFRPTGNITAPQLRQDTLNIAYSYSNGQQAQASGALVGTATPPPPPPGGPDLRIEMTYSRSTTFSGCGSYYNNFQNMDLILEGGGGVCDKGGGADSVRNCSFGSQGTGRWQASGGVAPEPYTNEVISHNADGADGTFNIRNRYFDDCAGFEKNGAASFMQFACDAAELRCSCWPPSVYPQLYEPSCLPQGGNCGSGECIRSTACLNAALLFGGSCAASAPSTAKTVVTIRSSGGAIVQQKAFCRAFQSASTSGADVVGIIRQQSLFRLGTTAAGTTELPSPNSSCP